jgi:catechol 1,2-dioxygenase
VTEDFIQTPAIQTLLDKASGSDGAGGDARLKAIMRDLLEAAMAIIVRHDVSESEFWGAVNYLAQSGPEMGLLAAGTGLEHFMDLFMDAKDAEAGLAGGTPRTIEGPLYVAGAPLVDGTGEVNLTDDPDDTATLLMNGRITDPAGNPVKDAILHVWHANSQGWYSHFDPTTQQTPFNNRRRIQLRADGHYAFRSKMPNGYSVPPGGATDTLMAALGRHGNRPAHVHFFVQAPGFRTLTTQINFGDDPFAADDFAFGTREGLLPVPNRQGDTAHIGFDFVLQPAHDQAEQEFSTRARAAA